jgi:hypothetical protein
VRTLRDPQRLEIVARVFQIDSITFDIRPNDNVAPGQNVAVVQTAGKRTGSQPAAGGSRRRGPEI